MSFTITIRKLHLAIAVLVTALIAPVTAAVAFHIFDDVPDDAFYADAVEWAADNGITTGRSPSIFDPLAPVTRGESVTFDKRYDDNIVQPALSELRSDVATNASDIAALEASVGALEAVDAETRLSALEAANLGPRIAALETVRPSVVAEHTETSNVDEAIFGGGSSADVLSLSIIAPASGALVIGATIDAGAAAPANSLACDIKVDGTFVPGSVMFTSVGDTNNGEAICSTTVTEEVSGGLHTVAFEVFNRTNENFDDAALWAVWIRDV